MSDPRPSRPQDAESAIDNLFVRLTQLTDQDLRRIRLAWDAQDAQHRAGLWRRALRLINGSGRDQLLAASRDRLAAWANDFATGRTGTPEDASWDVDRLNARTGAVPAVLDAVAALAAGEGLDNAERSFLTDPLRAGFPQLSHGRSGRVARNRRASNKATS